MGKRTAGTRWEDPKTPLKTASEIAIAAEKVAATEPMPATLPEAMALVKKLSATEVKSQEDWEALQPKLHAAKLQVNKLQQGLPILDSKSTDFNHEHMAGVMRELQLKQLVRTNPVIKELVDELAALKKAAGEPPVANISDEALAEKIYTAYCVAVGGKAFNGDPLPAWKDFSGDDAKKTQVGAWIAAAIAAKQLLTDPKTES